MNMEYIRLVNQLNLLPVIIQNYSFKNADY